jgi:hypothetical protein
MHSCLQHSQNLRLQFAEISVRFLNSVLNLDTEGTVFIESKINFVFHLLSFHMAAGSFTANVAE